MSVSSTNFQAFIQKHSYHNAPNSENFINSHLQQIPSEAGGAEESVQGFLQTTGDFHQAYDELYTPGGHTEPNMRAYKEQEAKLRQLMKQPGVENLAGKIQGSPLALVTKPVIEGDFMAFGVNKMGDNSFVGRNNGKVFVDVTRGEAGIQKFYQSNPFES